MGSFMVLVVTDRYFAALLAQGRANCCAIRVSADILGRTQLSTKVAIAHEPFVPESWPPNCALMCLRPSQIVVAISKYRQNALASCICRGVRHSASNTSGEPTRTQTHFAREVATFRRFEL